MRRKWPCTTLGGLLPPSLDILGALALIRRWRHHHPLPPGLLLPPVLLFLPSSIDIVSQCGVVLHLVIILNN
jgi:hypothetical protein